MNKQVRYDVPYVQLVGLNSGWKRSRLAALRGAIKKTEGNRLLKAPIIFVGAFKCCLISLSKRWVHRNQRLIRLTYLSISLWKSWRLVYRVYIKVPPSSRVLKPFSLYHLIFSVIESKY